ncbi:MAG: phosphoglycerate mutase, partial [Betaproteobacteria bacterium]|nr:phosphoglycerate mutase [Betaproteobacteria bacterium]
DLVLPAEWARAETLGWTSPHGTWPWAALSAPLAPAPQPASQSAWAFIRLCHWQVGNGQFTLLDPGPITQEESDALRASMRTYFEEDGITLQAHEPGRWLAQSSLFDGLASASAERVMGLPIEPWLLGAHLPSLSPAIRTLRRLQNEMQMLLYQHPVNDARRTPINSIWIEGCGQLGGDCPAPMPNAASAILLDDLREPWLLRDAAAWARAWQRLDAEVLPPLLSPAGARIAWCGPRQARWWIHQPPSVWQRLQRVLRPVQLNEVLSCDV